MTNLTCNSRLRITLRKPPEGSSERFRLDDPRLETIVLADMPVVANVPLHEQMLEGKEKALDAHHRIKSHFLDESARLAEVENAQSVVRKHLRGKYLHHHKRHQPKRGFPRRVPSHTH